MVQADLKVSHGSDSTTYQATGRFEYLWQGREYESDRISLYTGSDNLGEFQQAVHLAMKRAMSEDGYPARCFVNSDSPDEAVFNRDFRPAQAAFFSVFCVVFPLVGGAFLWGGILSSRKQKAAAELKEAHPGQDWLTDPSWVKQPIPEAAIRFATFARPAVVWILLTTSPILLTGAAAGIFSNKEALWMLIPGVFFIAAIAISWHALREWIRIGKVGLIIEPIPLRPGRSVRGAWLTSKPFRPRDAPLLLVFCKETTTRRSGNKTSTSSRTVWEKEATFSSAEQRRDVRDYRLPFEFHLPVDAVDSGEKGQSLEHNWNLVFRLPGTAVKSEFAVPVQRPEGEPVPEKVVLPESVQMKQAADQLPEILKRIRLPAEFNGKGLLQSVPCDARCWRAMIVSLSVFNLIWTAASVFLVVSDAPLIFKVVWPGSSLGIWYWVLHMIISRREMRVSGNELLVRSRSIFGSRSDRVLAGDVVDFSESSNTRVNNTPYYVVRAELIGGRKVSVVDGVAGRRAALGFETIWSGGAMRIASVIILLGSCRWVD